MKENVKNITDKHQLILQKLREDGQVDIQELSDLMKVSLKKRVLK
jgi:DeoR family transcriptional regulator of aga operon